MESTKQNTDQLLQKLNTRALMIIELEETLKAHNIPFNSQQLYNLDDSTIAATIKTFK